MDGSGLLDRTMIPDFPIPDSGIPNSEFRMAYGESEIPHHEIAGLGGAHERHMRSAGGRRGGADTGCPMPIAGWDIRCPRGVPGGLMLNPDLGLLAKEGRKKPHTRGIDWPTRKQSGRVLGRKEGGRGCPHPRGKEKPRRVESTGRGEWIGFTYRCRQGRTG